MKKIFTSTSIVLSATLTFLLTGCGSVPPPQPYNIKVQANEKLSQTEKQELLNKALEDIKGAYNISGNCLSYTKKWTWGRKSYYDRKDVCYTISDDDTINQTNSGRTNNANGKAESTYQSDDEIEFKTFIETIQSTGKITEQYLNNVALYIDYKKKFNIHLQEQLNIANKLGCQLFDKTKILNKSEIIQLSDCEISKPKENVSPIQSFIKYEDIKKKLKLSAYLKNTTLDKRMKITFDKTKIDYSSAMTSNKFEFNVNNIAFNYLPNTYVSSDNNIEIQVFNNNENSYDSTIKEIKLTNKTKEFIELDTIAGYYGSDVVDNILYIHDNKKVRIPPESVITFNVGEKYKYSINDFPSKKVLNVDSRNQKVNYGFSVAYKMINQNMIKNVYDVKKYTIDDLLNEKEVSLKTDNKFNNITNSEVEKKQKTQTSSQKQEGFLSENVYYELENGRMTAYMSSPDSPTTFKMLADRVAFKNRNQYSSLTCIWVNDAYFLNNFRGMRIDSRHEKIWGRLSY